MRVRRIVKWVVIALLAAAAGAAAWLVYAAATDIPHRLLRPLLGRLAEQGVRVETRRACWVPWQTFMAYGVKVRFDRDPRSFIEAEAVTVTFRSGATRPVSRVEVAGATVKVGPVPAASWAWLPDIAGSGASARVERVSAAADISSDGKLALRLTGFVPGRGTAHVSGLIRLPPAEQAGPRIRLDEGILRFRDRLLRDWSRVESELARQGVRVIVPLDAAVRFETDAANPTNAHGEIALRGRRTDVRRIALDDWSGILGWHASGWTIHDFQARRGPTEVHAHGQIDPSSAAYSGALVVRGDPRLFVPLLPTSVIQRLPTLELVSNLVVEADLSGCLTNSRRLAVSGSVHAAPAGDSGLPISELDLRGYYSNGVIRLDRLVTEVRPRVDWLPPLWREALEANEVEILSPLALAGEAGPGVATSLFSRAAGRLQTAAAAWRGIPLRNIAADFAREGPVLRFTRFRADIGEVASARHVTGSMTLDWQAGGWSGTVDTVAYPAEVSSVMPTGLASVVSTVQFQRPCHARLALGGALGRGADFWIRGRLFGEDIQRFGETLAIASLSFSCVSNVTLLDEISAVRRDGTVMGRIVIEPASRLMTLDVRCSSDPKAVACLVGPELVRLVEPYRIEGPASMRVWGRIGYEGNEERDVRIEMRGERLGIGPFLADRGRFALHVENRIVDVEEAEAEWCGGRLSGVAKVLLPAEGSNVQYLADLRLEGASFASVAALTRPATNGPAEGYEGAVDAELRLAGPLGEDFLRHASGAGRVRITNGNLLRIPLLGGLSRYLSLLVPGLGYTAERDFRAGFLVRDNTVKTDDAELLGSIISAKGRGTYSFDGALDFKVEVQFLREGLAAMVTRIIFVPLTKALEFRLTGTPADPTWRPVNTPERLLRVFTGALGTIGRGIGLLDDEKEREKPEEEPDPERPESPPDGAAAPEDPDPSPTP